MRVYLEKRLEVLTSSEREFKATGRTIATITTEVTFQHREEGFDGRFALKVGGEDG